MQQFHSLLSKSVKGRNWCAPTDFHFKKKKHRHGMICKIIPRILACQENPPSSPSPPPSPSPVSQVVKFAPLSNIRRQRQQRKTQTIAVTISLKKAAKMYPMLLCLMMMHQSYNAGKEIVDDRQAGIKRYRHVLMPTYMQKTWSTILNNAKYLHC